MFNKYHSHNISEATFLITGGAGFIGSNIVEYLVQFGAKEIRILDNLSTGRIENIKPFLHLSNVKFIKGDIREYDTCNECVKKVDFVSHQAALGSVPRSINDPVTTNQVNIGGFLNVLLAAKNNNIKRLVYAASSSTYGDNANMPKKEDIIGKPLSPYAITKLVNELYGDVFSRIYKFNAIGLRYFNVFGPRQNPEGPYAAVIPLFIERMKQDKQPIINGQGDTTRDFTFISNVIQANIKALFKEELDAHQVYNIACGSNISLNEVVGIINRTLQKGIMPEYREERVGDIKHSLADISKAKQDLGYIPEIDARSGIRLTVQQFLAEE